MAGLILHQSNRLEVLAERFAVLYGSGAGDPLAAEQVVVQNAGVARWLSLRVADSRGIAANLSTLFPAELSWSLMRAVLGNLPDTAPFSPGPLGWRILAELQHHGADYPELAVSLSSLDSQGIFQLARQLERLFDHYLFYRPEWVIRWESGSVEHWQGKLWNALRRASPRARHWIDLQNDFLQALPAAAEALPPRVSFFGISELSPGYLRLLRECAAFMDIHFFIMNPCRHYWGDIEPEKVKLTANDELEPYLDIGHPLLASLGRQGRDFIDLLELETTQEQSTFIEPQGKSILACLQRDILNLTHRGNGGTDSAFVLEADDSLKLNACHTPMREVEVLHDQILAMLDTDDDLQPSDIIVMTPSVEEYAPAIEAVFRAAPQKIPFTIADRKMLDSSAAARLFRQLLELPDSRYEVNRLMDLVEAEAVRQQFGLDEDAVARVRNWCEELRVRWGIDGNMRADMGLLPTDEHSWRAALDRLLLGSMLDDDALFEGILPFREVEGMVATDLGRLVAFLDKAFALRSWRDCQLTLAAWVERFGALLDDFLYPADMTEDLQSIRDALARIVQQAQQGDYQSVIDFGLARKLALDALAVDTGGNRFLAGGVVFCELAPMRSIPFEVVCLMGMDDGKFPAPEHRLSFDLMAKGYRRGDRSRRLQERYLFLESLLAARRRLLISWVGQDVITNDESPPSVLVSELLDHVRTAFGIEPDALLTRHPLQAFSRRYLGDEPALFTYANLGVADATDTPAASFIDGEISTESEQGNEIGIDDLEAFIIHPVRYFLNESLGLGRFWEEKELEEREPFVLGQFEPGTVRRALDQFDDESEEKRLRALGLLPHGVAGRIVLEQQREAVEALHARASGYTPRPPLSLAIALQDLTLVGTLDGITNQGLLLVEYDKPYHHQALKLWLRHLAYQIIADEPVASRLIYPDGEMVLQPVDDPRHHLLALVEAWNQGRRRPIRFMRKSAYAWQNAIVSPQAKSTPERAAARRWFSGDRPESCELAYEIAFRGKSGLFNEEFAHWSEVIWGGFLQAGGKIPK